METRARPFRREAQMLGDLGRCQPNSEAQGQQFAVGRRQAVECNLEIRQVSGQISVRGPARCGPGLQSRPAPLPSTRLPCLVGAHRKEPRAQLRRFPQIGRLVPQPLPRRLRRILGRLLASRDHIGQAEEFMIELSDELGEGALIVLSDGGQQRPVLSHWHLGGRVHVRKMHAPAHPFHPASAFAPLALSVLTDTRPDGFRLMVRPPIGLSPSQRPMLVALGDKCGRSSSSVTLPTRYTQGSRTPQAEPDRDAR